MCEVRARGYTLIELLIALTLLGIVSFGVHRILLSTQRLYHAQGQRVDVQQNLRAALAILPAEFREIASSEGDIYGMSATEVHMRAMRQFAVMCREPAIGSSLGALSLVLFKGLFNGDAVTVGDSLLLYYEGDEASRDDDSWWPGRVRGVQEPAVCPDGSPGVGLTLDLAPATATMRNRAGNIPRGGAVRGFVPVRYALYHSKTDDRWYLGLEEPAGSAIQPLVGPLTGSDGLRLRYFDAAGAITQSPDRVALIEIEVGAGAAEPVRGAQGPHFPAERATTAVSLRNNRRF
jgi:prepilin-type N-terminal cleavage/methylation domain-containing protein